MSRKICLIDADSIIYFSCFNKKDAKSAKTLQECKGHADDLIKNIMIYTKSTHYLLFLTVGKNFRYDVYPEYKGNRKYLDKPAHFDATKEYLITYYKAIHHPKLEADDLVCIYKNKFTGESFISSSDKDIIYLEGECFDYKNFKWSVTSKEDASLHFWTSMITGDTIDNIKGIPGKGIKFAESYLKIDPEDYVAYVTSLYINHFGEYLGVQEFYKNYMCLKMKSDFEGIEFIEPIEFNRQERDYKLVD